MRLAKFITKVEYPDNLSKIIRELKQIKSDRTLLSLSNNELFCLANIDIKDRSLNALAYLHYLNRTLSECKHANAHHNKARMFFKPIVQDFRHHPLHELSHDVAHFFEVGFVNMITGRDKVITANETSLFVKDVEPSKVIAVSFLPGFLTKDNTPAKTHIKYISNIVKLLLDEGYYVLPYFTLSNLAQSKPNCLHSFSSHTYGLLPDTSHVKIAYLPDVIYIDSKGYGPWCDNSSLFDEKAERKSDELVDLFYKFIKGKYVDKAVSKYIQPSSAESYSLKECEPYIFIPLQCPNDTVAIKAHMSQKEMVLAASELLLEQEKELSILVKLHPMMTDSEKQEAKEYCDLPNVRVVDANVHDLIKYAKVVVCVNSGVGFEALLRLKQVILCGNADYESVTVVAKNSGELKQLIFKEHPFTENDIKHFLYHYFTNIVVDLDDGTMFRKRVLDKISSSKIPSKVFEQTDFAEYQEEQIKEVATKLADRGYYWVLKEMLSRYISEIEAEVCHKLLKSCAEKQDLSLFIREGYLDLIKATNNFDFQSVLDVGAGKGEASLFFHLRGKKVTTLSPDIYHPLSMIKRLKTLGVDVLNCHLEEFETDKKFDVIWMSHVLEHTLNPGHMIEKAKELLAPNGWLFIAVPPMKPSVVGGHVHPSWTLGHLVYFLTACGLDSKNGHFVHHGYNIVAFVQVSNKQLPPLKYDKGDLEVLKDEFPCNIKQNSNGFDYQSINWPFFEALPYVPKFNLTSYKNKTI